MTTITSLEAYKDDLGNEIIYSGPPNKNVNIVFRGSNNKLTIASNARISLLHVQFDCDNGQFDIGGSPGAGNIKIHSRVGQDSAIILGENVSMTGNAYFSAVEGARITVGADVMFASSVQVRADDAHPIFDVATGLRVNPALDIRIGDHVWLSNNSSILGGAEIGDGSVVGLGALVNKPAPNNCIVAGTPAKVIKRNIAWERPHLSLVKPYYKPDATSVKKSDYWNPTVEEGPEVVAVPRSESQQPSSVMDRIMLKLGYAKIK